MSAGVVGLEAVARRAAGMRGGAFAKFVGYRLGCMTPHSPRASDFGNALSCCVELVLPYNVVLCILVVGEEMAIVGWAGGQTRCDRNAKRAARN